MARIITIDNLFGVSLDNIEWFCTDYFPGDRNPSDFGHPETDWFEWAERMAQEKYNDSWSAYAQYGEIIFWILGEEHTPPYIEFRPTASLAPQTCIFDITIFTKTGELHFGRLVLDLDPYAGLFPLPENPVSHWFSTGGNTYAVVPSITREQHVQIDQYGGALPHWQGGVLIDVKEEGFPLASRNEDNQFSEIVWLQRPTEPLPPQDPTFPEWTFTVETAAIGGPEVIFPDFSAVENPDAQLWVTVDPPKWGEPIRFPIPISSTSFVLHGQWWQGVEQYLYDGTEITIGVEVDATLNPAVPNYVLPPVTYQGPAAPPL